MAGKILFVCLALLVGCLAVPTPEQYDFDNLDKSVVLEHADRNARIVGGTQAADGAHPHMVALTTGLLLRSLFCGGSILTQRTILTAAHCIAHIYSRGSLTSSARATVGTNRWNSGGQTYQLSRNISHPHYVAAELKNDLGLLITSSNIAFTTLIQPASVTYDFIHAGVPARAAGWGRIRAGGAFSAALLEVDLATIDGAVCVREAAQASITLNIRAPAVQPHIEICTYHAPGFGTCNGDSGSALTRISDGRQIGLVSWGFPCARGAPDMFVRISAYADWLNRNVV